MAESADRDVKVTALIGQATAFLAGLEKPANAREMIGKALELNPANPNVLLQAARTYEACSDFEHTDKAYEKAQSCCNPSSIEVLTK